jgi:phosphonate transport system permease protein
MLFDRVFPPRTMTVGERSVQKPRSRAFIIWLMLIAAVWGSVVVTGFDVTIIIRRGHQFTVILEKIFRPDWGYFDKVLKPLLDTIKMSVIGSVVGCVLALPVAVVSSTNINKSGWIVAIVRLLVNVVRTLPTLVIASIFALIFGLGTFAGMVAITIFTFGVVTKMLYESIETIDMGAFEAMEALGATKFQAFMSACWPQILPTYLSHCLYSFEINVRAASILGYVGAGGLGILINERIGWRDYEGLGTVLIALFVVVLLIENASQYLRRKLS